MKSAAVAILTLSSFAAAADYPRPTGYVNDFADRLSPSFRSSLEERLRAYEQETGKEIAVVTVPSLQGESIETYATGLFNSWGIGKRDTNDGVLFLWAPQERKVRVAVGRGLDRLVPHAASVQIIEDVTARFRGSDFEGGVTLAVDEIMGSLEGSPPQRRGSVAHVALWIALSVLAAFLAGLVLLVRYAMRRARQAGGYGASNIVRTPGAYDDYSPGFVASNFDSGSSSSSSSSDSGSFGGGDTSGGGASGDY